MSALSAISNNCKAFRAHFQLNSGLPHSFIKRLYIDSRRDEFNDLSHQYLLEEIAVFSLMYEQQEAIDIYPGTAIFAALVFQDKETNGAPVGLNSLLIPNSFEHRP